MLTNWMGLPAVIRGGSGSGAPAPRRQREGWAPSRRRPQRGHDRIPDSVGAAPTAPRLRRKSVHEIQVFAGPKNRCRSMSYFGGTSLDYAEDAQRIYRLDWGTQGAADVPDDLCY